MPKTQSSITRHDLCQSVSKKTGFVHEDVDNVIKTTLDEIIAHVARGHRVVLRGFGTWERKMYPARPGNVFEGNKVVGQKMVPANYRPKFTYSKWFYHYVRDIKEEDDATQREEDAETGEETAKTS